VDFQKDERSHWSHLYLKCVVFLINKINERNPKYARSIYLFMVMPLRLTSKVVNGIGKAWRMVDRLWGILAEEWPFIECKLTVIGTSATIAAILVVLITKFSFPFPLDYARFYRASLLCLHLCLQFHLLLLRFLRPAIR